MCKRRTVEMRIALALLFLAGQALAAPMSEKEIDATRQEFRRLIDRPRVALEPKTNSLVSSNGLEIARIQFASDAQSVVPGLLVRTSGATRQPAVIVAHGTGGNKNQQLGLLQTLARAGFVAVAIDGRYHGERTSLPGTQEYNQAILDAFKTGHGHPLYYDTVWDIMRLVDYLQTRDDVEPARIGMIGFSKGGIETYFAAAADPRIAVAVPCIGMQEFSWGLEHQDWHGRTDTFKQSFEAAARESHQPPDAGFAKEFFDHVTPGIYSRFDGPRMIQLISPRPLLLINGEIDHHTPLPGLLDCAESAREIYAQKRVAEKFRLIIEEKTEHKVTPAAQREANEWFKHWLK